MARHYSIITIFVQYSASEGWRGWLALCNFENSIRGLGLARVGLITVPGGNSPGHYSRESDLVTSVNRLSCSSHLSLKVQTRCILTQSLLVMEFVYDHSIISLSLLEAGDQKVRTPLSALATVPGHSTPGRILPMCG